MQKMAEYVAKYQKLDITEQLNQVYESESSSLDPELTNIQVASMRSAFASRARCEIKDFAAKPRFCTP